MARRPIIKISLTVADKLIEGTSLILLVIIWSATLILYHDLPDQIPIHFNAKMQADAYNDKSYAFIVPFIVTFIYSGMSLINRYPHIYNYPIKVTAANAVHLYTAATRLIRKMKLIIMIVFGTIVFITYRTAITGSNNTHAWFLPATISLLMLPNLMFLIKIFKARRSLHGPDPTVGQ